MNYTQQLELIRRNLALVEACYAAHPDLFVGADNTILTNDPPWVSFWSWSKTQEQKQAMARAHPQAGWKRKINPGSDTADWVGIIDGVQFSLGGVEKLDMPGDGSPVEFAPAPVTASDFPTEREQREMREHSEQPQEAPAAA